MKKIIAICPIAILFILLSNITTVFADSNHYAIYVTEFSTNMYEFKLYNCWSGSSLTVYNDSQYKLYGCSLYADNNGVFYEDQNSAVLAAYQYINRLGNAQGVTSSSNLRTNGSLIITNGINNDVDNENVYSSYDDYINPPEPEITWWERVAQIFIEFATSPAMGAVLSGDWLGYINEVLFGELWSVKVGEGEDELAQFYTVSATPSPSPTPIPTQIPVQVNIDPNTGNVTYNYTIDVSGTPVPTSSPVNPNPPAGSCGGGSELTEPFGVTDYYEPDDSLSIPNLRIFQFQLDLPGSNTDIGVDSLDNNVEVMNGYLEDNADAITTVSSFFQVIPSDWFLLLGAIACFPIIAAMIKSLLGG